MLPRNIAQVLIEEFKKDSKPSKVRCIELARETGLQVRQVTSWFKMRRFCGMPKRLGYTETQRRGLLQARQQYGFKPSKEKLAELATKLGLTFFQVRAWFNKHRYQGVSNSYGHCLALNKSTVDCQVNNNLASRLDKQQTESVNNFVVGTPTGITATNVFLNQRTHSLNGQNPKISNHQSLQIIASGHTQFDQGSNVRSSKRFENKMASVGQWFDMLETKITGVDTRFNILESKSFFMDQRVGTLETKMTGVDKRFDALDVKVANLSESISNQHIQLDEIVHVVKELCQQVESMQLTVNSTSVVCDQSSAVAIAHQSSESIIPHVLKQMQANTGSTRAISTIPSYSSE